MRRILGKSFYDRPTLTVARELLGKWLVRQQPDESRVEALITEVETYDGPGDLASHASRGRTPRNRVMFGPAGRWYVYFTYGRHYLLNIVTGPQTYPAAVLIRGVTGMTGPARVTKRFGVDLKFYDQPSNRKSGLWIEDRDTNISQFKIKTGPRVGVAYAGPVWSRKEYRFLLE